MSHNHDSMSGMDDMSSTSGMGDMKMYFHGSIGGDMLWFASWMPSSAGATVGVCIGLFLFAVFERYLVAFRRACDAAWRKGQLGYHRPVTSGSIPLSTSSGNTTSLPSQPALTSRRSLTEKDDETRPSTSAYPVLNRQPTEGYHRSSGSSIASYSPDLADTTRDESTHVHAHLPKAVRKSLDPGREGRWSRPFRWSVDLPRGLLHALQTLIHYLLMLVVMTFNIWWIISVVIGAGVGEMLFGRFGASHSSH
ncbi:hypothetical protein I302_101444 [Kwoniella bestiolae CBS 10118]|uniref:Copper transport protein n=1 Tax=Kwoniella bestiolae CBS 10118 TaxID=1296100 RepID=A0A1B9GC94_9TREE|nr:hypothetical protein I302_00128 [Kwoniella bestiolae CBS 10118]OCF28639.1 hypothetical protein I302_00128 [Kwoniella bestiolae CBS 10118]